MKDVIKGEVTKEGQSEIVSIQFADGEPKGGNRSGIFYFKEDGKVKGNLILPIYVDAPAADNRFDGVELAERLVFEIDRLNTATVKDLKANWEYKNEGTKVVFTAKDQTTRNLDIWIESMPGSGAVEWDYIVENEQEAKEEVPGVKQVSTLNVTATVHGIGSIKVTFNDGVNEVTKAIQIVKGDTADTIAEKIAEAFSNLEDWNVEKAEDSSDVVFTAKEASAHKDISIKIK